MPGAFGTADEAALKQAAAAEPGTDGIDLVAAVTCTEPYTVGDGPRRVVAYDFGIKATILRHLGEHRHRRGRAGLDHRPPTCSPVEPDGVFLSNGPGDPAAVALRHRRHRGAARRGAGLRHLPRPPAAGDRARRRDLQAARSATTAATTRCGDLATGTVEITSQNHNYCVDRGLARRRRGHPRQPQRRHRRGLPRAATCPAFSVQYHPEAGPGPARRPLPVRTVRRPDGRPRWTSS